MEGISRRKFLVGTGVGAATAGIIAAVPTLATPASAAQRPPESVPAAGSALSANQLVVHVPDPRSGEVHFMIGTREVVQHDKALVARLLRDLH